jgi:hypothetical protein
VTKLYKALLNPRRVILRHRVLISDINRHAFHDIVSLQDVSAAKEDLQYSAINPFELCDMRSIVNHNMITNHGGNDEISCGMRGETEPGLGK